MKYVFYDTCSLLLKADSLFDNKEEKVIISSVSLKELEEIKTSDKKDAEIKYSARHLTRFLEQHKEEYTVVNYLHSMENLILEKFDLPINNDSKILATACYFRDTYEKDLYFCTNDLCLKNLALMLFKSDKIISVQLDNDEDYTGFKELDCSTPEELADFYSKLYDDGPDLDLNLFINEYIIIKDQTSGITDRYRMTNKGYVKVPYRVTESKMFGKISPKDDYQILALDSFHNNKITMIEGRAGSGKSLLSLGYLFEQLEKGKIDKIIIFCNTIAAAGAAKLGFYPGDKNDKLLDSQIGNMLSSKLGDRLEVERLIFERKLILLPLSDLRGYDTTGLHAGIYITEAQNLDIELMRLALQRIGEDSICIIDGDTKHQVDSFLYAGDNNGMRRLSEVFKGCDYYGEVELQNIYRSRIAKQAELM